MDSGAIVAGLGCLVNPKRASVVTRLDMERPPMAADPRTGLMLAVRVAHGTPLQNSGAPSRALHTWVMRLSPGVKREARDGYGCRSGAGGLTHGRGDRGGGGRLPGPGRIPHGHHS